MTFASVFQSLCFNSLLRSSSILVGRVPSKSTRTLSFFFTLFGAFELAGEEIIHHQRCDIRRDAKILLRVIVEHVQLELVAAVNNPRQELVYPELFLVRPLAHRVHQPSSPLAQITARFQPRWRGEELPQIGVVEIRIRIFVELPFARVISLELEVQAIVLGHAVLRRVYRWRTRQRAHQLIDVLELLQRLPARVTLAPVEPRRKPDREGLREIFVRVALRIPIVQMHDVAATERAWPVGVRCLFARRGPKNLPPLFLSRKLVGVGIGMCCLVPHQFHEPFRRLALDLEHHRPLQRTEPVVHEKKRHEDRRDTNGYKPFIADVSWRMKYEPLRRKLVIKLPDKRFESRAIEPQAELGDAAFEKFL